MSTTLLARPRPARPRSPAPDGPPPPGGRPGPEIARMVALAALLVGAALPLGRVFVGWDVLQPALGAAAVAVAVTWGCQRLGAGPLLTLLGVTLGWVAFASVAFFPDTLRWGLAPTWETAEAAVGAWQRSVELVRIRPAPAFPEAELVFLTVTGVWAIAYLAAELVFRLDAPARAIGIAMVLWGVPLTIGPQGLPAWPVTIPLLAGAALLLLAFAGTDVRRWGTIRGAAGAASPRDRAAVRRVAGARALLTPTAWVVGTAAIVAGVALAHNLPGFGDRPLYDVREGGGGSVTTNPIVSVRANLVAQSPTPVVRVSTPRPVYLRTTSLDVYSAQEEWTNDGIRGAPVPDGGLSPEVPIDQAELVDVTVTVEDLSGALLVPAPYQPVEVGGPASAGFQYDRSRSTLLLGEDGQLADGDEYSVSAAVPDPEADALAALSHEDLRAATDDHLVALPDDVPESVAEFAREVVADAGAGSPFAQALAIQAELRSWEYSLDPPPGHGGRAIESFLENRIGYCEQYAATMAVMLRTLDVPARVAVGYTPGRLVDTDDADGTAEYAVARANAHAWVEVLFPDHGWIAFEPTPRDDGNVLVPSASNLAPRDMVSESGPVDLTAPPADDFGFLQEPDPLGEGTDPGDDPEGQATVDGASDSPSPRLVPVLLVILAAGIAAVVAGVTGSRRKGSRPGRPPADRVLDAGQRVERVGRGLGVRPQRWETDREYLERLAGEEPAVQALATSVARARWATTVPEEAAEVAEESASRVTERLLSGKGGVSRWVVAARGTGSTARASLETRVRRGK